MLQRLLYSIFFIVQVILAQAQDVRTAAIHLWNDQKVHVAGEDVWVDGIAGLSPLSTKTVVLRLINRNGTTVTETEVVPSNNRFHGTLSLPESLASDYYFIDAYVKGIASTTVLCPIMVIHPALPPVACTFNATKGDHSTASSISVQLKKQVVSPRSPVEFTVNGTESLSQINVAAVLNDRLLALVESASNAYQPIIEHGKTGEVNREGKIISVSVLKNGAPAMGLKLIAAYGIPKSSIATAITDQNGKAQFILPLNFNDAAISIRPVSKNEKNSSITIEKETPPEVQLQFPCLQLNESMKAEIETRVFNSRVMKRFYGNALSAVEISEVDSSDFYGRPDALFYLDDYVRFPDMEEVIAEIIPQVRVKKNKEEVLLQVVNQPLKTFFDEQALVLVDGLPVSSAQSILETDPLLIRSIEVISRKYVQGTVEFSGIVHFKTYKGDIAGLLPDEDMRSTVKSIQENTTYLPADHSSKKDRMPDLRNLLFLEKDVTPSQLSKGLRFYASDAEASYKIIIRGINSSNQFIIGETNFEVKKPD